MASPPCATGRVATACVGPIPSSRSSPSTVACATPIRRRVRNRASFGSRSVECVADTAQAVQNGSRADGLPVLLEVGPTPRTGRLSPDNRSFFEEHRIRGYEVGPDRKATMVTIANLLQESGSNHLVTLWGRTEAGFGGDPIMVEKKLFFAATRIQIQLNEYPMWGDIVELETWFQPESRITASRNWQLKDATTGRSYAQATSTWVLISMKTRRLSKVPNELREVLETFSPEDDRIPVPANEAKLKLPDVEEPFEFAGPVQVARRSDMDMNGHINNVTYIAWTLETVPEEVYNSSHLFQVEIDFKHECKAGDTVESLAKRVPSHELSYSNGGKQVLQFVHVLRRCDSKGCTELVRARTTWLG